LMLVLLYI